MTTATATELCPKGQNRYCSFQLHGSSKDLEWFFGLKRPRMSVQNLSFARPSAKLPSPPLFSIISSGKRRQDVLPARLLPYFTPATFYFFLKVKSELASCLLTLGIFKKRLGGSPPPSLQRSSLPPSCSRQSAAKKHILLMTMAKNYLNNFLFKINSFQVMSPCAFVS